MFEWFAGVVAGLSRKANPGMVVCVALVCVTALAWAPRQMTVGEQFDGNVVAKDSLAGIVLLIIASLAVLITLTYLLSRVRSSEPDNDNADDG